MTAPQSPMKRLGVAPPAAQSPPLTRKAERRPASGTVLLQSSGGERAMIRLRDISAYGCNLVGEVDWLRIGIFVTLRLSGERSIQAIVRWIRAGSCGVEFLRPIPDADAEWLSDRVMGY